MQLINDFITLPELCRRWQCEFELIQAYTENRLNSRGFPDIPPLLQAYKMLSIRECHKGTVKACTAKPVDLHMRSFETPSWSWDEATSPLSKSEIVFDMREVRLVEAENPALLCASVPFDPAQDLFEKKTGNEQEFAQKELKTAQARIAELKAQLWEANRRTMEAEKKSNPGCEAASEKRLQQWKKNYFPAIHAVARQCEEEGPKEGKERRQRKDIRAMLEAYLPGMEVPNAVVNYTFSFLDDSLVDRTGGNT